MVTVADVVGSKVTDAVRDLQRLGFRVERIPAEDDNDPSGRVVAQSPIGGTKAPAGSTVRIEVSGDSSG
jgi:serine/threonine-protein kinase